MDLGECFWLFYRDLPYSFKHLHRVPYVAILHFLWLFHSCGFTLVVSNVCLNILGHVSLGARVTRSLGQLSQCGTAGLRNWCICNLLPFANLPSKMSAPITHLPATSKRSGFRILTNTRVSPSAKYCRCGWKWYLVVWICTSLITLWGWASSFCVFILPLHYPFCELLFHIVWRLEKN